MNRITRSFVFLINLLAILLLLLAYLSIYISPALINFISFLGFGFPLFWFINLFFVLFWLIKRRKRLLLSLALIIVSWSQLHSVLQFGGGENRESNELNNPLTVMSYNVRMFDKYVWTKDLKTPQKIYDFIKNENPDVLCIQEFYINNKMQQYSENNILSKFKQYKYKHLEYNIQTPSGKKYGLATFSKYPIVNKKPLFFENTSNFSIQTDIQVRGKNIRVFNNHLESIRLQYKNYNFIDSLEFKSDEERMEGISDIFGKLNTAFAHRSYQAETIGRHIKNSPFPTIVCGDFNDTPISYVYRQVKGNLKDSFMESGSGIAGTYNGNLPPFRIDFIFHDASFNAYNHQRVKVYYSDHFPVKALLDLEPNS